MKRLLLSILLLIPSLAWSETTILTSCGDDVYYLYGDGQYQFRVTPAGRNEYACKSYPPNAIHYPSCDLTWVDIFRRDIKRGAVSTEAVDVYSQQTLCGSSF